MCNESDGTPEVVRVFYKLWLQNWLDAAGPQSVAKGGLGGGWGWLQTAGGPCGQAGEA